MIAPPPAAGGARRAALALALLAFGVYAANLGDYFLGDDFDLIHSFHGKPARYFLELLWSNESGDVWKSWGIDPALGRGYLRPLKIWLLALDLALWGTHPLGFHLVSSAFFVANVLLAFAILRRAIAPGPLAFAGAAAVAVHPIFAEVVPFLTAREELAATAFGLGSFLGFVRHRLEGRSALAFPALYGLALLTKESAIVFLALPLAFDLADGRLVPRSGTEVRALARSYASAALVLAIYFALRWIAFGNLVGGDGEPTHYLSPAAFLSFHQDFFRSLVDPTLLLGGGAPGVAVAAAGLAALLVGAVALRLPRLPRERTRWLLVLGPLWYLASTAILHGTYFAVRHHLLPVIGLLLFATVLLDSLAAGSRRRARALACLWLVVAGALWLPATLRTSAEYRQASAAVSRIRAAVEERSAGLPPGSAVALRGVPQWVLPPFFFGWGLLSALQEPFTESDLARRSTVVNARNLELTRVQMQLPERYDLVIEFDPGEFVTPELESRQLQRLRREGILPLSPARPRGSPRRSPRRGARSRAGRDGSSRRCRAARPRPRRSA